MKRYLYWSGGKDSSASIVICYEKGIHLDGIIMSEVMFDHSRNISGENPKHIDWVYNVAIPIIEKQFGYKVHIIKDHSDYIQEFYHVLTRSKIKEKVGKHKGFFIGGMCDGLYHLKLRPQKQFAKSVGEHEEIVGIAVDENNRLERLNNTNKRSVLAENDITEEMTYDICKKYNLLSPLYENKNRGGCWFCPNQSIKDLAKLKKEHPNLWQELKELSQVENLASDGFKWGKTFSQVEEEVDIINSQLNMFD